MNSPFPRDPRDTSEAVWPESTSPALPLHLQDGIAAVYRLVSEHLIRTAAARLVELRPAVQALAISCAPLAPARACSGLLADAYLALRASWQSQSPAEALHHERIALDKLRGAATFAAMEVS